MAILFPVVFIMDFRLLGATVRNGEPSAPGMVWIPSRQPGPCPQVLDGSRMLQMPDVRWLAHVQCPICLGQRYATVSPGQRRGPSMPVRAKVFSGWGRAREGEGQFLPKNAPPPLASLSLSPVQTGQALIVMPGGTTAKTSLQLVELVHGFASVGDIMHQDLALL